MGTKVQTIIDSGNRGLLIDVECHLSNNLPNIVIVGFANRAVDEAKERVRGAFASSRLDLPRRRITINLAPADIPKHSSSFDLSIAAAILVASGQSCFPLNGEQAFIGELGLNGDVRPVRGIIGKLLAARANGLSLCFIPQANLKQAGLVPGIQLTPLTSLGQLAGYLQQPETLYCLNTGRGRTPTTGPDNNQAHQISIDQVVGQAYAKRALEIAAAGGHNLFLDGPPGTGKSLLAKALASILPPMSHEEMLETTQLHSLASNNYEQIITKRPFRNPHHSVSQTAITGGGSQLYPGEISLSHHGVLLFDELPEFQRSAIEALRQPLEEHRITLARAKDRIDYPANFIFVATANPCPCGYYGVQNPKNECNCLPYSIQRYRQKLSGPLLDRIDLYASVGPVEHSRLLITQSEQLTARMRSQVAAARHKQAVRFRTTNQLNSTMDALALHKYVQLNSETKFFLDTAARNLQLSARAYLRTVKVSQTIADLAGETAIRIDHISEALQYRSPLYES